MADLIILILSACAAGALNAIAGGGTFLAFPSLLLVGVSPIAANATCTVALWPGAVASIVGYKSRLKQSTLPLKPIIAIAIIGGWIGAELLLNTSEEAFAHMVPWLLLIASIIFTYGKRMIQRLASYQSQNRYYHTIRTGCAIIFMIITALYGGFFGAGIGILTLAMLYMFEMEDIHDMNAIKTVIASCINSAAFCTFIFSDFVAWEYAVYMAAASIAGGFLGARLSLKYSASTIRKLVIAIAWSTTAYFFIDFYST